MPAELKPIADKVTTGAVTNRLEYLNWPITLADTIYLEDFDYANPPGNVGLASIYLSIADTGAGTPTITPTLEFKYANGVYGPAHSIEDHDGNSTFAAPGEFEARLDVMSWWKIHVDWRIVLTRSANSALYITYAYGCTL